MFANAFKLEVQHIFRCVFLLQVHYFSIDQEFIYEPFFADFGLVLRVGHSLEPRATGCAMS